MSKLPIRLTYFKRCNYCNHEETYIMRESNVNTNITDDDAIRIASQYLGSSEAETCEGCGFYTQHIRVAYNFGDKPNDQL